MASDLLTVAEVKEHVETGLSDIALGRLIDAQDAYIRRMVGPHDPATTMAYERDILPGMRRFWLPRIASSVDTVEDRYLFESAWTVREETTYYLSGGGRSVSLNHWGWDVPFREVVRVTFTPVPENAERTQALIDLVRLEAQDTGLQSETDDTFEYIAKDKVKARQEIIAPLKRGYRMLA